MAFTVAAHRAAFQGNGGASRVSVASAARVPRRAASRAGMHESRTVAAASAAIVGSTRSTRVGRNSHRKKFLGMTLSASGTTAFSGAFWLFRRSRYRRLCPFRFRLPAPLARHFCRAFHADHLRAALQQPSLQYRWRACRGVNHCPHPLSKHFRFRGRRTGRFRPPLACFSRWRVGFSGGPMGGERSQKLRPWRGTRILSGPQ
jgi:hypothetical protein